MEQSLLSCWTKWSRGHAAVIAIAIGLAGCGGPAGSGSAEMLPRGPMEVQVTISDEGFEYEGPIPSGRVVLRIDNTASQPHKVTLLPLPNDMPPLAEQLHGPTRIPFNAFAGTRVRQPGTEAMFAVDLVVGRRYGLVCLLQDPDGQSHARQGFNAEFRARPAASGAAAEAVQEDEQA